VDKTEDMVDVIFTGEKRHDLAWEENVVCSYIVPYMLSAIYGVYVEQILPLVF
jgi:hypothetical protein